MFLFRLLVILHKPRLLLSISESSFLPFYTNIRVYLPDGWNIVSILINKENNDNCIAIYIVIFALFLYNFYRLWYTQSIKKMKYNV